MLLRVGCAFSTSCPAANSFKVRSGGTAGTITNLFDGQCMEGMLGPQRSSVVTNPCAAGNIKQQWTVHADGTIRGSNNRTEQCLTAEAAKNMTAGAVDIFAGALSDGGAAVLFFNRGTTRASATLDLAELSALPGWKAGGSLSARDAWTGGNLPAVLRAGGAASGELEAHGSLFVRLAHACAEPC